MPMMTALPSPIDLNYISWCWDFNIKCVNNCAKMLNAVPLLGIFVLVTIMRFWTLGSSKNYENIMPS